MDTTTNSTCKDNLRNTLYAHALRLTKKQPPPCTGTPARDTLTNHAQRNSLQHRREFHNPRMQGHDTHPPHHNARGRHTRATPTMLHPTRHTMHPGRDHSRNVAPHPTASHRYNTAPQRLQPQPDSPRHRPHNTVGKQQHAQSMPALKKHLEQLNNIGHK